jgi:hypothetical protein
MKSKTEEMLISDIDKMAILDWAGIQQTRCEYKNRRYYAFFEATEKAKQLLSDYESGKLTGVFRDYSAAQDRVKTRIFDASRKESFSQPQSYRRGF